MFSALVGFSLLEKYPNLFFFFANTWWISMKRACMRRPSTFICMREFFSRMSIASVDGKQHLSEVVFSALVGFSLEGFDFYISIIPTQKWLILPTEIVKS